MPRRAASLTQTDIARATHALACGSTVRVSFRSDRDAKRFAAAINAICDPDGARQAEHDQLWRARMDWFSRGFR